jgi:hypothetical protein
VGPATDLEIVKRAETFERAKTGYRARRDLAARLRRAGYPSPQRLEGEVIAELAKAGLFRLRATLVGSTAYQTYSGILGVRLPDELITTEDVDIAKFHSISISIDETMPDMEIVLKKVDPDVCSGFFGGRAVAISRLQERSRFQGRVPYAQPRR